MVNFEDAARLRELCEKASREYDHDKLLDLVHQINELLEKRKQMPTEKLKGKSSTARAGSSTGVIDFPVGARR